MWLSGRALAAQPRSVLGSSPGGCWPFSLSLFLPHNIQIHSYPLQFVFSVVVDDNRSVLQLPLCTRTHTDLTDPATFRDLSKPVGALTEERLLFFQVTWEEMATVG